MTVKKQKNGKWLCSVRRDGIPRVRKSFESKKEAEDYERFYLAKHAEKQEYGLDKRTITDLIGIWFRYHGVNLSDGARRKKKLDAMANELGDPIAANLTKAEFLDYRFSKTSVKGGLSPKSFNNLHGYLSATYRKLHELEVIDYECPTANIEFIPIQERQLSYLDKEQVIKALELAQNCSNECVWWNTQICIRTGARWGEAELLTKKQLHNNSITFEFTKSKKTRTVPLDKLFFKQLMEFCKDKSPNERIFRNTYKTYAGILERSDLVLPKGQNTHILRHTFASHFIMNGGDILTLQRILGHSDIKMTMRYAHLAPDHLLHAITCGLMTKIDNEQ
mgnify:CR=1 FL=1